MPFLICDLCKVRKNCAGKGFVEGSIVQCLMVSAILHIPKRIPHTGDAFFYFAGILQGLYRPDLNSPCPALCVPRGKNDPAAWRRTTSAASRHSRLARVVIRPTGANIARSTASHAQPVCHARNPTAFLGRGSPNPAGPTKRIPHTGDAFFYFAGIL